MTALPVILITRRNWCEQTDPGGDSFDHRTVVQIRGLENFVIRSESPRDDLLKALRKLDHKLVCECLKCITLEGFRTDSKWSLLDEPMVDVVTEILQICHRKGFDIKSTTAVQNGDGSTSTVLYLYSTPKPQGPVAPH